MNHGSLNGTVPLKSPQSLIFSLLGCPRKFGGTFMWNLVEPCPRFRAAAPNHPEALLEEPQVFQAVEDFFGFLTTATSFGKIFFSNQRVLIKASHIIFARHWSLCRPLGHLWRLQRLFHERSAVCCLPWGEWGASERYNNFIWVMYGCGSNGDIKRSLLEVKPCHVVSMCVCSPVCYFFGGGDHRKKLFEESSVDLWGGRPLRLTEFWFAEAKKWKQNIDGIENDIFCCLCGFSSSRFLPSKRMCRPASVSLVQESKCYISLIQAKSTTRLKPSKIRSNATCWDPSLLKTKMGRWCKAANKKKAPGSSRKLTENLAAGSSHGDSKAWIQTWCSD